MRQMNKINLLPQNISAKIAAGEVVDRPFSIVKELVENSIDAGADNIVVEIKNGGKSYIRVSDNGEGIPTDQVKKAFLRHATSKIVNMEDLDTLDTLGFRGEALASIAAVSRVELVTKVEDESTGTRLLVEGGHFGENKPIGCPEGTTIIIRDVFYNTPARLKFMKSDASEATLIIDFLSKMALAYPTISFRAINNGTALFSTRGNGKIYDNIISIYSKQIGTRLIQIDEKDGDYHIQAYISPTDTHRASRKSQVYFVNGRSISNKLLEEAVADAYRERIPQGRFPLIYLFLKLPQSHLDVNIHPNKKEIRFDHEERLTSFVSSALLKGLRSIEGLPDIKLKTPFKLAERPSLENKDKQEAGKELAGEKSRQEQVNIKKLLSTLRSEGRQEPNLRNSEKHEMENVDNRKVNEQGPAYDFDKFQGQRYEPVAVGQLEPLGSVFATYIIAIDESKLYLIDQHAAHERIFYERLLRQFESQEKDIQMLLSPIILDISPKATASAELWMDQLKNMGFDMEMFGIRALRIRGIPSFMELEEAENFLYTFVEDASIHISGISVEKLDRIISKSCKTAIKGNNLLKLHEMKVLLQELASAENPFSCPHGRPTMLVLSKGDVERMFKRT